MSNREAQLRALHRDWDRINLKRLREGPLVRVGRRDGKPPCGECHLQEGEVCDICGATHAAS